MLNTYSGKTVEEIKNEVVTDLYLTGRYNQMYFGRTSSLKINPLKIYIQRFLRINGILSDDNEYCEECYQTLFYYLSRKPPEWFLKVLEESPNGTKLIATACFIIKTQCFAIKDNPRSSGLIFNMLNNSSYMNIQISTSEKFSDSDDANGDGIIIYDEHEPEEFELLYDIPIEDILKELPEHEQSMFYNIADKKGKRGKPSKKVTEQKLELYKNLTDIKENINSDIRKSTKTISSENKKYKSEAEIKQEYKTNYNER